MFAKYTVLLSCVFLVVIDKQVSGQPAPFFRKDYEFDAESQAFYKEHTVKRKWGEAQLTCAAEGAQLATPLTEGDLHALLRHKKNDTNAVFLGIHDLYTEGDFVTINGISVSHIFMNWRENEPNDSGGVEDCVVMFSSGLYNDANCDLLLRFICKKDLSTLTNNSACETYDTDYKYSTETDRCYKFHTTPRNWNDAYKICFAEESHLGFINGNIEATVYTDILKQHPAESMKGNFHKGLIHLGFSDLFNLGDFKTIDGKSLAEAGYEEWAAGQPDNTGGAQRCGSMYRDGKLNDIGCHIKATFICEKRLGKSVSTDLDTRFGQAV